MKIELYTKQDCALCEAAKQLLNTYQQPYTEIKIGQDISREEVLENFPNARMAPIVVIDDGHVPTEVLDFILRMNRKIGEKDNG
jgi:glutaredoxin